MEYSKRKRQINLWQVLGFAYIALSLICFTVLVPPFEKPDEYVHFIRALSVSNGVLFCKKEKNNIVIIEKKYIDLPKTLDLIKRDSGKKYSSAKYLSTIFKPPEKKTLNSYFNLDPLCSFPFISYIPHAVILKFLSYFNLNGLLAFLLGRIFFTSLAFIWFLFLLKKIQKEFRFLLIFSFSLPMSLYQVSSYSYDAVHILSGLTFFTFFTNLLVKKAVYFSDKALLFISLTFLTNSKRIGYELFALLFFLLPLKKITKLIFLIFLTLFSLLFKISALSDFQQPFHSRFVDPKNQISYILQHPINFVQMLISTTALKIDFYIQGIIGIFGWLEYGLEPVSYLLIGFIFLYLIFLTKVPKTLKLPLSKLIFLIITLIFSYIYIVTSSYLFWTGVGESVADGVQGRYFLVFVPFIVYTVLLLKNYKLIHKLIIFLSIVYILVDIYKVIVRSYFK